MSWKCFVSRALAWSLLFAGIITARSAASTIVVPTIVSESNTNPYSNATTAKLIDNSGMTPSVNSGDSLASAEAAVHVYGGVWESWVTGGSSPDYFAGNPAPEIVWDVTSGGNTDVSAVVLWQYQNDGGGTGRVGNHARTIKLQFNSETDGGSSFSGSVTTVSMDAVLDGVNSAQAFALSATQCRYIRMVIADNHYGQPGIIAGGDRVGLGEVRFAVGTITVPVEEKAYGPNPEGSELVSPDVVFQWHAGHVLDPGDPGKTIPNPEIDKHILYLGPSPNSLSYLGEVSAGDPVQPQAQYGPVPLEHNTTYFWRVDEYISERRTIEGNVWSFTTSPSVMGQCSGFFRGDINQDCKVGPADLEVLAQHWLAPCSEYECGDLDESGEVDAVDFSVMAADWGKNVSVVINEFMASNESGGIVDEDGTTSDWIELRNYASYSVNLDGWYLTDSRGDLDRWRIPAVTLDSGEYLVIFASAKDRSDPAGKLHTNFVLDIEGEYLALVGPDGRTVEHEYSDVPVQYEDISYGLAVRPNEQFLTGNYFLTATPEDENNTAYANLGPVIFDVAHAPAQPNDSEDLIVTAQITKSQAPVASVHLIYRVMYTGETVVSMPDDGVAPDIEADDGIYTAAIPATVSSPGQMVRYAVRTQDTTGGQNRLPLALDLFGKNQSPEYFGTVVSDPSVTSDLPIMEWFTTNSSSSHSRTGARASVYYLGRFYDNIFIRQRGQATNAYSQKFDFNKGYDFYVNDKLSKVGEVNMNARGADPAYIRQSLAFNTHEWCGTPSCESFLVLMQLNGSFDRVGVLIEQVDEDFLRRYGRDPDGALYKFIQRRGESAAAPEHVAYLPHTPCFSDTNNGLEKKTRRWEDFSDLQAVVDGLMSPTEEQRRRFVFDNLNLPEIMNYLAARAISNDCDDTRKNFYFYRDTLGTGEWEIYPWDNDFTFGIYGDGGPHATHPFFGDEEHLKTGTKQWNVFFDVMFKLPETRQMYLRRLRTMMDELLQPPGTSSEQLKLEAICDAMGQAVYPHLNISGAVNGVKNFFPRRRGELYEKYGPSGVEPLIPESLSGSTQFVITDTLISGEPGVTLAEYFVPNDGSLALAWTERDFAGSWETGHTAVGYERSPRDALDYRGLIEADINDLMGGRTSVYIRIPFNVDNPDDYDALVLYMKYDDNFVAYINGVRVPGGSFVGNPSWNSSAGSSRSDSICMEYEQSVIPASMLVAGRNVLAIHGLNDGAGSSDLLFLPELKGAVNMIENPAVLDVDLDHVEYNPASGIQKQEYIRLTNNATVAVDISGWRLTGGISFTFAPGTVIPTGRSLYVSPDQKEFRARTTSPKGDEGRFVVGPYKGRLSNWGETIDLLRDDSTLVDSISYLPDPSDAQRYLRITEIMYHPAEGGPYSKEEYEYIELLNTGPSELPLDGVELTDGIIHSFGVEDAIPAGQYRLLVKNQSAFESRNPGLSNLILGQYAGSLDNGGETIDLEDASNSTILEFTYNDTWFDITDGAGFSLTIIDPEGSPEDWENKEGWRSSAFSGGSPGTDDSGILPDPGAVVINEILAHSHDEASDWIELYNTTGSAINMGGWYLSDSASDLKKYRIAPGTTIGAGQYKVFQETTHFGGNSVDPGVNVAFALSENGETAYLSSAIAGELAGYRESQDIGASATGVSYGRYFKGSTGNYNFVPMSSPTTGQPNAYPKVGPIVISEISYNPSWPLGGAYTNDQYEYIEIKNISAVPITLYRHVKSEPWKITDGVDFTFPDVPNAATIVPGDYLVIARNPEAFTWRYPSVLAAKILGPYDGSLSNGGERVQLSSPGDIDKFGVRQYIREDRVVYSDGSHPGSQPGGVDLWPTEADGQGASLHRIDDSLYGNDPNNWRAADPSPGE